MKLYIVRHGQTDWNIVHRIQGQVEVSMNEAGRKMVEETAKGLSEIAFDCCFTSPTGRTVETAEMILAGQQVPIIWDERLTELSFGELEGKRCTKEHWEVPDSFQLFFTDPEQYPAPKGGEDFHQLRDRVAAFFTWLFSEEEYEGQTILLVTHRATLACMLNYFRGESLSKLWDNGVHRNCEVAYVEVKDQVPDIIYYDKTFYDPEQLES